MKEVASSNEDKRHLCYSILENSLVIPDNYRGLIVETLMRIPENDLCKIQLILDRFIFIAEGTRGASEHFLWQCMAKHKMKRVPRSLMETSSPAFLDLKRLTLSPLS